MDRTEPMLPVLPIELHYEIIYKMDIQQRVHVLGDPLNPFNAYIKHDPRFYRQLASDINSSNLSTLDLGKYLYNYPIDAISPCGYYCWDCADCRLYHAVQRAGTGLKTLARLITLVSANRPPEYYGPDDEDDQDDILLMCICEQPILLELILCNLTTPLRRTVNTLESDGLPLFPHKNSRKMVARKYMHKMCRWYGADTKRHRVPDVNKYVTRRINKSIGILGMHLTESTPYRYKLTITGTPYYRTIFMGVFATFGKYFINDF